MNIVEISATTRDTGKGAARSLRRNDKIPVVLYGPNQEPRSLAIEEADVLPLVFTNETSLVRLASNGDQWECILKDIDFHPVTDRPLHADFLALTEGEELTLSVPLRFQGTPIGQTEGGYTQFLFNELEIRCVPKDIPSALEVDISELEIGDAVHIEDIEVEGVTFTDAPERTVVTVVPPRELEVEEEEVSTLLDEEGEPIEGEELPEGEEAPEGEEGAEGEEEQA